MKECMIYKIENFIKKVHIIKNGFNIEKKKVYKEKTL